MENVFPPFEKLLVLLGQKPEAEQNIDCEESAQKHQILIFWFTSGYL